MLSNNNYFLQTNENLLNINECLSEEIRKIKEMFEQIKKENFEIKKENTEYKMEIIELKKEIVELKKENTELKNEIVELKKENTELKKEIVELKKENAELKKEIVELKKENVELKTENAKLKNENAELRERIVVLETREQKRKIITSLQDLNSIELLEQKLNIPYNKSIQQLRKNRNVISHYTFDDDDDELIKYKKLKMLEHYKNLDNRLILELDKKYKPGFIGEIINYLESLQLKPNLSLIPVEDIEEADDWWYDV
jgi:chromosome segregation ATPase